MASLIFCVHISCAQQYLFTRYTPKDGLVNSRARFITQDSKGRLYISTFGGLSVYDGSRFINYTTDNGLAAGLINDIVEMGDDSLWIMPNAAALHVMTHGVIRDVQTADDFYPVINQLLKCSDGHYYALGDEGLFRYEKNRFVKIPLMDDKGDDVGRFFTRGIERNGQLFLLNDPYLGGYPGHGSLVLYDTRTGKWIIPENPPAAPAKSLAAQTMRSNASAKSSAPPKSPIIYSLAGSPEGDILLATGQGIRKIDTAALKRHTLRLLDPSFPYQAADSLVSSYMYFDRSGNLWLSSSQEIIKIGRDGERRLFNADNGLPDGINNSIFEDAEDNFWFTNDQNGISKLANQELGFYTQPYPGFTVTDLYANGHGDSAWFYDDLQHALLLIAKDTRQLFRGVGFIPAKGHIVIGKSAYMISGSDIYSLHFLPRSRQFILSLISREPANSLGYYDALTDRADKLVLVSDSLTILASGKLSRSSLRYMADQVAIDKNNRIWIVTRANELFVYRSLTTDTGTSLQLLHAWSKELPKGSPRSIAVDSRGLVWMGTRDHGLYCLSFDGFRMRSQRQLTTKNGLSENFIDYLQCDPDNTIWACTPSGLDKIRLEKGRFTVENSTRSNSSNHSIYKILRTGDGIHWALASGGVIKIGPPAERQSLYRPHVLFSKVSAGNEPLADSSQQMALPYDRNALSFLLGTSTFIDETQTRYTYLLEGSHAARWSAPSEQSDINFVNLPPGKYTLKVAAQFLNGRYPEQMAAYPFVILPPWWQTWWFRILLGVSFIVLAGLGIRVYTRRKLLKQRMALEKKQAIEKERTRIATDMHDDLGAGLSRIKFLSETIGIRKQQQLPIEDELIGIRQYSHEMIDKMGEIVWALNEKNDSLNDLLSYTRAYAVEYLMQAGIDCKVEAPVDPSSRFVSGEFRRNIYLTIKEALHNIVKHAQAGNVSINMEVDDRLTIILKDDGVGFDRQHIRPFSNGLNNMEKRIHEIGGTLVIGHGSGTTIRLSVPI
jgi:signal transduction histidine kinase/ligand-binding sensor domain-containing protein